MVEEILPMIQRTGTYNPVPAPAPVAVAPFDPMDFFSITDTAKRLGVGPKALFSYMRNPNARVRWLIQRSPHADDVVHQDRLNAGDMANPVEQVTVYPRDEVPREKLVTRTYVAPKGLGYLARLIVAGKDPLLPVPVDLLHVLKISRGNHLFD